MNLLIDWPSVVSKGISTKALHRLKIRNFIRWIVDMFVVSVISFFFIIGVGTVVNIVLGKPL